MTEFVWSVERAAIVEGFGGQLPRPEDEAAIVDVFEAMPQAVVQSARELVGAVLAGEVKWGWSTLRSRLERGRHPVREVVVDPANEQAKAEAAAERWLANAGCHFDQESEVVAELFDRGPLRGFRTVELEHQVLDRWVELRETVVSGAAA